MEDPPPGRHHALLHVTGFCAAVMRQATSGWNDFCLHSPPKQPPCQSVQAWSIHVIRMICDSARKVLIRGSQLTCGDGRILCSSTGAATAGQWCHNCVPIGRCKEGGGIPLPCRSLLHSVQCRPAGQGKVHHDSAFVKSTPSTPCKPEHQHPTSRKAPNKHKLGGRSFAGRVMLGTERQRVVADCLHSAGETSSKIQMEAAHLKRPAVQWCSKSPTLTTKASGRGATSRHSPRCRICRYETRFY